MSRIKNFIEVTKRYLHGDRFVLQSSVRRTDRFRFPRKVFFATYHKAGTVWFSDIFLALEEAYGFGFRLENSYTHPCEEDVFFCDHSDLDWEQVPVDSKLVHLIRDPRDMLVSACFYHQRANEKWLFEKNYELGGKSYQEALLALPNSEERLRFEMLHGHNSTMRDMKSWEYQVPNCLEIRYEDFITDYDLTCMTQLFRHIDLPQHALGNALNIAYQTSLFPNSRRSSSHIRSGRPGEWKKHFTPELALEFESLHGDFLIQAGYENDESWVDEVRS